MTRSHTIKNFNGGNNFFKLYYLNYYWFILFCFIFICICIGCCCFFLFFLGGGGVFLNFLLHLFIIYSDQQLDLESSEWSDVNIVTGCLKLYLRELPDPLLPFRTYKLFIDSASECCCYANK